MNIEANNFTINLELQLTTFHINQRFYNGKEWSTKNNWHVNIYLKQALQNQPGTQICQPSRAHHRPYQLTYLLNDQVLRAS